MKMEDFRALLLEAYSSPQKISRPTLLLRGTLTEKTSKANAQTLSSAFSFAGKHKPVTAFLSRGSCFGKNISMWNLYSKKNTFLNSLLLQKTHKTIVAQEVTFKIYHV